MGRDPQRRRTTEGCPSLEGLTLPGLANVHSHAFHRALRGRTQEAHGSFWTWRDLMYAVADRLDPDGYLRLARGVYAEMALAGFTTVGEFHYLHHGPAGVPYADRNVMAKLIEAARLSGVRLTLLDACYQEREDSMRPSRGHSDASGTVQRRAGSTACRVCAATTAPASERPSTPCRPLPPLAMAEVAGWAGHAGLAPPRPRIRATQGTDRLPAPPRHDPARGAGRGRHVHPGFTAVHGTHLADTDIAGLALERGGCSLCPTTERDLGDGIGPAAALRDAGVALSLGTDSHTVIDGFEEARTAELDARLASRERGLLHPAALLEAATKNGTTALGWDAGALAPGRLADFITIRLDSPRTAGARASLVATAVLPRPPPPMSMSSSWTDSRWSRAATICSFPTSATS